MILRTLRKSSVSLPKGLKIGGSTGGGGSFRDILHKTSQGNTSIPSDPFKAMEQLATRLERKEKVQPAELLQYQLRAGQFGIQVELVSKVGESLSGSLRKLQQQG